MANGRRLSSTRPGQPAGERHLDDPGFAAALTGTFGLQLTAQDVARLTAITAASGS